ncbi:MAG: hypothetical protein ACTSUK_05695 [Promethearchaeota archaeon]
MASTATRLQKARRARDILQYPKSPQICQVCEKHVRYLDIRHLENKKHLECLIEKKIPKNEDPHYISLESSLKNSKGTLIYKVFNIALFLIEKFDMMGDDPKIIAGVAFIQANRLLNQNFHQDKHIFSIFNYTKTDRAIVKKWCRRFLKRHTTRLYDKNNCIKILNSTNYIGEWFIDDIIKESAKSKLDDLVISGITDINSYVTAGVALALTVGLQIDHRTLCNTLNLDLGEFLSGYYKYGRVFIQLSKPFFSERQLGFVDLMQTGIIRIGDHLTYNLDEDPELDVEIIDYGNVLHNGKEIHRMDWSYQTKNQEFLCSRYLFHRETGLSLKVLLSLALGE